MLEDTDDRGRRLVVWPGAQRIANRRLLMGTLHRPNEPELLVTGGSDGVRVELVGDTDVNLVEEGVEGPLAAYDPRKLEPGRSALRCGGVTLALRAGPP